MRIFRHILLLNVILFSSALLTTGCKPEPTLSVSAESLSYGEQASEQSVTITSNTDWRITGAEGWCSAVPSAGNGNATVRILAGENNTPLERVANLTITAETLSATIKLTQRQKDALLLSQKVYNLGPESTAITADLKSNITYEIVIPSGNSWITGTDSRSL